MYYMTKIIDKDYIKDLFYKSEVAEIIPTKIIKKDIYTTPVKSDGKILEEKITPVTKAIIDSLSPYSQKRMRMDIEEDNKRLRLSETKDEDIDPDYTYFENKEIGLFLEKWYCANYLCVCGKKFVKYTNKNMPIIDIRCSNIKHDIQKYGPIYYQIKSTESNTTFNGYKYFDLSKHYIHTGSKKYGELCHNIKTNDIDKNLLIGYICISYKKYEDDSDNKIQIIEKESFKLAPKIDFNSSSELYYKYIDPPPYKNAIIIMFNEKICNIELIKKNIINIHQQFNELTLDDEFFYMKYIKYKLKYLDLKKNKSIHLHLQ